MNNIDKLAFLVATSAREEPELPSLTIPLNACFQFLTDMATYNVLSSCVKDPKTNIRLHPAFPENGYLRIQGPHVK
jgi:hypothetical protein